MDNLAKTHGVFCHSAELHKTCRSSLAQSLLPKNHRGRYPFYFYYCAPKRENRSFVFMPPCQSMVASPLLSAKVLQWRTNGSESGTPEPSGLVSKRWLRGRAPKRKVRTSRVAIRARKGRGISEYSRRRICALATQRDPERRSQGINQTVEKMGVIILLKFQKKKDFCEKYLWKVKPKAFPGDGIEWDALENGCSEASSSVQQTQMQTHVVLEVEDGFNELHRTHTHTVLFFLNHQMGSMEFIKPNKWPETWTGSEQTVQLL